jgi:hypothetical protein
MQFVYRDFTNQFISNSYQDVVQRYLTGSTDYFLDGLGYVIVGIPTSSIGGIILTQDQTASWAETSSYSLTSSFELQHEISSSWSSESFHSIISDATITASYSFYSEMANTSSISILSEYSDTASLSLYSNFSGTSSIAISASWVPNLYPITSVLSASWVSSSVYIINADTASYITASNIDGTILSSSYSVSASYTNTASFALNTNIYVNIDGGSPFTNYGGIQQQIDGGQP